MDLSVCLILVAILITAVLFVPSDIVSDLLLVLFKAVLLAAVVQTALDAVQQILHSV
jgi:hypothetical protein